MNLSGILPAVVTPLDDDERFVAASFERLLERVYSAGSHGVYVSGQTGEGWMQPLDDRESTIEVAVRNSPAGKTVVAHIGAHRTPDAIRLAKTASRLGVAAISSLPPLGRYSFQETKLYYEQVASAVDVPLLVYYFPQFSQAIATLEAQRELLAIPNVVGIKYTDFDLYSLSRLKKDGAIVFNGHDEVLAAGLLMGADGGIGSFYNLVPELFVDVYNKCRAGDYAAARATQERVNDLIEITLRFPMLSAIKCMLGWAGIPCGLCFEPRRALTGEEEDELARLLAGSSFAAADFVRAG